MLLLYAVLSLGALTTVYPFLLMAAGGMRGATDANDSSIIPRFWRELDTKDSKTGVLAPESLLAKYLSDKYAGDASLIASTRTGDIGADTLDDYERLLKDLPVNEWHAGFRTAVNQVTSRLSRRYQDWLRTRFKSIDDLNKAYIEENTAFQTVQPPSELLERKNWNPPKGQKYADWLEFKRSLPPEFRIPIRTRHMWQEYMRAKSENDFSRVPEGLTFGAKSFETLPYPVYPDSHEVDDFLGTWIPERLRSGLKADSFIYAHKLRDLPIQAYEEAYVTAHREALAREFTWRNYGFIVDYVALHGPALWNTVLFCLLAILTQLTVNPLAAYALSRYPMKQTGRILMFLLSTMAFPAEVAMIPSFLLLKDLGLLNTFAALVLPTAASGYMIFLLKGFFDSLPLELFEAAQIDGARETTMLARIALPLSRPVLGYLALTSFMGAYGAFMYAFLVAQDQRIWTLMVFIYQLQNSAPKPVMLAALTVAAVPTLIVFLCAQRVIMQGIILPGEK